MKVQLSKGTVRCILGGVVILRIKKDSILGYTFSENKPKQIGCTRTYNFILLTKSGQINLSESGMGSLFSNANSTVESLVKCFDSIIDNEDKKAEKTYEIS